MGNSGVGPLDAGLAGQLTHVAIGDAISATHWGIVHVAQSLAALTYKINKIGLPGVFEFI